MQSQQKRCGAKKRDGSPCPAWAMPNGRCRMHGGKIPRGIALPQFKTGKYSASIPARLAAQYQDSQRDPRLLELRDDISLLDARLGDLLKRVDTGESGALWSSLIAAKAELASIGGTSTEATLKRQAIMGHILDLITKGHADHQAWRELGAAIEQRRKLVESERKRMVEAQQMITTERAMLLLGAVVGVIKEHISDRATLAAISTGIDNLLIIEHG